MSALYRDPPAALAATRFCTAQVTRRFFAHIGAELAGMIEPFTLAAPLVTDKRRLLRPDHVAITPAPRRHDIGKVIVGVCDDDIAFAYRRFFEDASGTRTRFQSFWNQDDGANTAAGLGYGSELLKLQMDALLERAQRMERALEEEGVYRIADYAGLERQVTQRTTTSIRISRPCR